MNKFCVNLKEHETEIVNCHRKKILPLTKKEKKSCKKPQKFCQKCKEEFNEEFNEDQNQPKV